jgi:hypothetical protein
MGWDTQTVDNHDPVHRCAPTHIHHPLGTNPGAVSFRAADFTDILSSELILICIASYLTVPSLLALSSINKQIRSVMHNTPGVWRTIDLSNVNSSNLDIFILKFVRQPYVARDCRILVLDGLDFDHEFLDQILVREMPALQSISLLSCPNLNGDQLIKLIQYIRRPSAPRPLSLRRISLLGAPLFPLNQSSSYAPDVVAAAGSEITTDLHSLQCFGKDHIATDRLQRKWHLKLKYPNHPCAICGVAQNICMKCHVKKSCVGCHSFYCDECEPYPSVFLLFSLNRFLIVEINS